MAAERGARVVLSSRNEAELREVVTGIRERGGMATYFAAADVADPDAMQKLAQARDGRVQSHRHLGEQRRASACMAGLTESPTRRQAPHVRHQLLGRRPWLPRGGAPPARQGGAIINIGSGRRPIAPSRSSASYAASKHAVKGYTDTLRMELEEEEAPISVTLVKPSVHQHALHRARAQLHGLAAGIRAAGLRAGSGGAAPSCDCAERPTRDITVGGGGKVMTMMGAVAPRLTDAVMERTMFEGQKKDAPPYNHEGALDAPQDNERRHGSTEHYVMKRSAYTRAVMSDVGRALPMIAFGALVAASVRAMRRAG